MKHLAPVALVLAMLGGSVALAQELVPQPRRWTIARKSQRDALALRDSRCRELEKALEEARKELSEVVAEIRSDLAIPEAVGLKLDPATPYTVLVEILPEAPKAP